VKSRIDRRDLEHLEAFPGDQKEKVMRKIMSVQPTERVVLGENHGFEKAVLKLRREGYGLIDVQRQEIAFSCIWVPQDEVALQRCRCGRGDAAVGTAGTR
jgi:hypothetical protein